MSQKKIWAIVIIVVIVAAAAGAVYWKQTQNVREKQREINYEQELIESFSNSLNENPVSGVGIPTANPLEEITSETNPLENTNPFDEQYENPFE